MCLGTELVEFRWRGGQAYGQSLRGSTWLSLDAEGNRARREKIGALKHTMHAAPALYRKRGFYKIRKAVGIRGGTEAQIFSLFELTASEPTGASQTERTAADRVCLRGKIMSVILVVGSPSSGKKSLVQGQSVGP